MATVDDKNWRLWIEAANERDRLRESNRALVEALETSLAEMTRLGEAFSRRGGGATTLGMACLKAKRAIARHKGE